MNTQHHGPLLSDDEILSLLTPQAAIAPEQEQQHSIFRKPLVIIGTAILGAAGVAAIYFAQPTVDEVQIELTTQAVNVQPVVDEEASVVIAQQPGTPRPIVSILPTTNDQLAALGIHVEEGKIWFVEDGRRVTISTGGIALRPTSDPDLGQTPTAVTLYDDQGAYASWYDQQQGSPEMNQLVPVRIALTSQHQYPHQGVTAVLWFAPREANEITNQIAPFQEQRHAAQGVRVENIFPNPATGSDATLVVNTVTASHARVTIMDIAGRELAVVAETVNLDRGTTTIMLTDLQSLPTGMALVVVDLPELGTRLVQRLLIQH